MTSDSPRLQMLCSNLFPWVPLLYSAYSRKLPWFYSELLRSGHRPLVDGPHSTASPSSEQRCKPVTSDTTSDGRLRGLSPISDYTNMITVPGSFINSKSTIIRTDSIIFWRGHTRHWDLYGIFKWPVVRYQLSSSISDRGPPFGTRLKKTNNDKFPDPVSCFWRVSQIWVTYKGEWFADPRWLSDIGRIYRTRSLETNRKLPSYKHRRYWDSNITRMFAA